MFRSCSLRARIICCMRFRLFCDCSRFRHFVHSHSCAWVLNLMSFRTIVVSSVGRLWYIILLRSTFPSGLGYIFPCSCFRACVYVHGCVVVPVLRMFCCILVLRMCFLWVFSFSHCISHRAACERCVFLSDIAWYFSACWAFVMLSFVFCVLVVFDFMGL